jgi:hypothetical protein
MLPQLLQYEQVLKEDKEEETFSQCFDALRARLLVNS